MKFKQGDAIQERHWHDQHPFRFEDCPVCQLPRGDAKMMANGRCPTCWLSVIVPWATKCQWEMGCRAYATEIVHVRTNGIHARHIAYCAAHHGAYKNALELMRENRGSFRV